MDKQAYLERIHFPQPWSDTFKPSLKLLRTLHEAHLLAVPFENLSIHYGQPIVLQEEKLFRKIVDQRRGGFCYELNGLFAWFLSEVGFRVSRLSAGVANAAGSFGLEFDHLTLLIHDLEGADWLADVGFGDSFRQPLRFEPDMVQTEEGGRVYRLHQEDNEHSQQNGLPYWIMQELTDGNWTSQYRFTLEPHELADFTEMCQYHQTSPESHFTQKRICSLATQWGRVSLSDLKLITTRYGKREERMLTSEEEYRAALAEQFGIIL